MWRVPTGTPRSLSKVFKVNVFQSLTVRTRTSDEFKVSQRDATEKLADQVAAQIAAADRRVEEASGDPHEEEKDEAHKSSKGHVSEPAAGCPTSPESLTDRISSFTMDHEDKDDLCVGSLPRHQTKIQEPQRRVKTEDEQQRLRPPD